MSRPLTEVLKETGGIAASPAATRPRRLSDVQAELDSRLEGTYRQRLSAMGLPVTPEAVETLKTKDAESGTLSRTLSVPVPTPQRPAVDMQELAVGKVYRGAATVGDFLMSPLVGLGAEMEPTAARALPQDATTQRVLKTPQAPGTAKAIGEITTGLTAPAILAAGPVIGALPSTARIAAGTLFSIQQLHQAGNLQAALVKAQREADIAQAQGRPDEAKQLRNYAGYLRTHEIAAGGMGALGAVGIGTELSDVLKNRPSTIPAPAGSPTTTPRLTEPPRMLPPQPPIRGGRVTADFADKPPYTPVPERTAIPGTRGELPAKPIEAEFVDVRPGFPNLPDESRMLETRFRGEQLRAGPPTRQMLKPAPEIELPERGGTIPRGTIQGQPGGILQHPEATITPTGKGSVPRTRSALAAVDVAALEKALKAAQLRDQQLSRRVNTAFGVLGGRPASPEIQDLARRQQENRRTIQSLQDQLQKAQKWQTVGDVRKEIETTSTDSVEGNLAEISDRLAETDRTLTAKLALRNESLDIAPLMDAATFNLEQAAPGNVVSQTLSSMKPHRPVSVDDVHAIREQIGNMLESSNPSESTNTALVSLYNGLGEALQQAAPQDRKLITQWNDQTAAVRAMKDAQQPVLSGPQPQRPMTQNAPLPMSEVINFTGGVSTPALGQTAQEAATILGRGRRPELLKEGKAFDETALVSSPLFQGRGGRQGFLESDLRAEPAVEQQATTPYAAAVTDTAQMRLQQFLSEIQSGATEMTGKTKRIEGGGIVGRFKGGIKKMFPELADFEESPSRIAEAITKDKGNPLYRRVLEASKAYVEDTQGEQIARAVGEAANADTFDFGSSGEKGVIRSELLRPIHLAREAAYNLGEKTGQPILDAISRAFNRITPEAIRKALATGEFERPESYIRSRHERAGRLVQITEATARLRDRLIASLPDAESQRLAAKLAKDEPLTDAEKAAVNRDPNIRAAAEYVRTEFMKTADAMVQAGLMDNPGELYGAYLPRLYRTKEAQVILKKHGLTLRKLRLDLSRTKHRQDLPENARKAMQEIEGIIYPAVKGYSQENILLANNDFFRQVARDPLSAEQPGQKSIPSSWKQLPETKALGDLSGKFVHPTIHYDLVQMIQAPSDFVRYMDVLNKFFKKNKTVRNPATHVKNVQGNYVFRDFGGMEFATQFIWDVKALREYRQGGVLFREAQRHGLFGNDFVAVDLHGLLNIDQRVAPDNISAAADFTVKLLDSLRKVDKGMEKAYQLEDSIPRLSYFMWLRTTKGYSPADAVRRTFATIPEYSNIAPVADWMRRQWWGPSFISFQASAFPVIARAAIKHPLKMMKYLAMPIIAGEIAAQVLGESKEQREQERREMPPEMRPEFGSTYWKMPFRDKYGRTQYLDMTYVLPILGNLGESGDFFGLSSFVSGPIRAGIEAGIGQNLYLSQLADRPVMIYNRRTDTFPQMVEKGAGHFATQMLPSLTPVLGTGYQRLQKSFTDTPDALGNPPQTRTAAFMHAIAGQRTVPIDVQAEARKRRIDVRGRVNDIEDQMRGIARNQSLTRIEKAKRLNDLEKQKQTAIQQYQNR
jgi:hypothetical protein